MCRRKGRVVLVGDVGLNLKRADLYQKEIDFLISCSYGPGRYDGRYEEEGLDYPIGYVRWTENRNMGEYLRLIAEKRIRVQPLIAATFPVERASEAYDALQSERRPLLVVLSYSAASAQAQPRVVANPRALSARPGAVRVALVGAGGFAKGMHLPNLQALGARCHLQAVISRTGANAVATARQWGANYAGTDFQQVLDDRDVDAVIIATRHHLHTGMALAALRAGKHVLLEKPLALTAFDADAIEQFFADETPKPGRPMLLTGFNRRFSPHARRLREWVGQRSNPMMLDYRMNAGYLPAEHWTQTAEGGGRNLGEACHIYDLFTYLTNARVERVQATAIRPATAHYRSQDNFTASMSFSDGSVATLTYTSLGAKEHPKEQLTVFVDGKAITLDDYKSLTIAGGKGQALRTRLPEKGQKEELDRFFDAIANGGDWPIPLWEQVQATRMALDIERSLMEQR